MHIKLGTLHTSYHLIFTAAYNKSITFLILQVIFKEVKQLTEGHTAVTQEWNLGLSDFKAPALNHYPGSLPSLGGKVLPSLYPLKLAFFFLPSASYIHCFYCFIIYLSSFCHTFYDKFQSKRLLIHFSTPCHLDPTPNDHDMLIIRVGSCRKSQLWYPMVFSQSSSLLTSFEAPPSLNMIVP